MFIYLNGLLLGLSLIMTLGPQNIFLIKQGTRGHHAGLSVVVCFLCDVILIFGSVTGVHTLLLAHPQLQVWLTGFGAAFLLFYAIKTFISFFSDKNSANETDREPHSRLQIIIFALGFSLLNPHAIIDCILIIGSGSNQFPGHQTVFLLGVVTSSLVWFSSLFFTTRYFSKILSKGVIWKSIELFSGCLMTSIGIKLVRTVAG